MALCVRVFLGLSCANDVFNLYCGLPQMPSNEDSLHGVRVWLQAVGKEDICSFECEPMGSAVSSGRAADSKVDAECREEEAEEERVRLRSARQLLRKEGLNEATVVSCALSSPPCSQCSPKHALHTPHNTHT